ncbi:MAG: hypothetical protein J0H55_06670 [Chitinophagaceae bacterium]|nr:hypothetical protein [Chitinophagaceae bacterium]
MQNHLVSTPEEVAEFLKHFKIKMKIWDVLFRDDRGKNTQSLLSLEITPSYRKTILEQLDVSDYSQGPIPEKLYGGSDMWIFGKVIKKREVYIKITIGVRGCSVICISFHIAENKMTYPLK